MPDLGNAFSQWLLGQLDGLPTSLLREGAERLTIDRILAHVFEEREAASLRALLNAGSGDAPRVSSILVPGLLGSQLASTRGLSAMLWFNPAIILDGYINLLDLSDDGSDDRSPDVDISPVGIEKMSYLKTIMVLAQHSRLYEFPYDWRYPIDANAHRLHESVERWTSMDPDRKFVLVCHSMGGLVTRSYLNTYRREAEQHVERVVFVGVPLHGAPAPALAFSEKMHPGRLINRLHERNDIRQLTINMPSMYQLLPPPEGLFEAEVDYPFDFALYDAAAWPVPGVRQEYLDRALAYHERIHGADPQVEMVHLAGCQQQTITSVRCAAGGDCPLVAVYAEPETAAGDGQVPCWSTRAMGIKTHYVVEHHNQLCTNDHTLQAITQLLHGEPIELPTEPPEPADVFTPLKSIPLVQRVQELRERIEEGRLSRKDLEDFFFTR